MRFIKKEWFQITFLLILFLTLLYTPFIIRTLQNPPDRYYTGADKFYPDYYSILSIMNFGSSGTLYPVHVEYQVLGKISSALNIPNYISYHLAKIIVSALIFLSLYKLAFLLKFNKPARLLMMISGLFLNAPPIILHNSRPPDMFNLYTQSMHHELGILLTILLLIFYLQKKYLFLLITALILGITHTVSAILVAMSVFLYALIFHKSLPARLNTLVFGVVLLSPLVFYKIIFTLDPALSEVGTNFESAFADYDLSITSPQMFFSYLFYLSPFIILSLPVILKKKMFASQTQKTAFFLALFYILADIFMYIIGFYFLKIGRARFSLTALPIAFAIIISLRNHPPSRWNSFTPLLLLIFSLPTWFLSVQKDAFLFGKAPYFNEFVYPDRQYMEGFFHLKTLPPGKTLALDYSGNFLTSFGEKESYLNSRFYTTNYEEKLIKGTSFFEGKMPPKEAEEFLKAEKITYVYLGLYERRPNFDISSYNFLTKIFTNPKASIFKTK